MTDGNKQVWWIDHNGKTQRTAHKDVRGAPARCGVKDCSDLAATIDPAFPFHELGNRCEKHTEK
jgi:hypothetical protein